MASKSNRTESRPGSEKEISTIDLRTRVGEIFNQVVYGNNTFIVKRKGKEVGAIIPMELVEEFRKLRRKRAEQELVRMLEKRREMGSGRSDEKVLKEACKLVDEVRKAKSSNKRKRPRSKAR